MHPLIREVQKKQLKTVPEIKAGYTIRVHQKIKEGEKERIQNFEGLVIAVGHGEGIEKTFTVRRIVEGIGVEKVFPLHSPQIDKIEVRKKGEVRRAKLNYMRNRAGKSARLREHHVTDEERAAEEAAQEKLIEEAVVADKKRQMAEAENQPAPVAETAEAEVAEAEVAEVAESPADEKTEA